MTTPIAIALPGENWTMVNLKIVPSAEPAKGETPQHREWRLRAEIRASAAWKNAGKSEQYLVYILDDLIGPGHSYSIGRERLKTERGMNMANDTFAAARAGIAGLWYDVAPDPVHGGFMWTRPTIEELHARVVPQVVVVAKLEDAVSAASPVEKDTAVVQKDTDPCLLLDKHSLGTLKAPDPDQNKERNESENGLVEYDRHPEAEGDEIGIHEPQHHPLQALLGLQKLAAAPAAEKYPMGYGGEKDFTAAHQLKNENTRELIVGTFPPELRPLVLELMKAVGEVYGQPLWRNSLRLISLFSRGDRDRFVSLVKQILGHLDVNGDDALPSPFEIGGAWGLLWCRAGQWNDYSSDAPPPTP
jgi:hypothetical protein